MEYLVVFLEGIITFLSPCLLPMIPVYSNIYFDFYPRELQNYDILYYITWGDAIVPATFEDYVEPEPETEEGEEDEDDEGDGDDLEFAD